LKDYSELLIKSYQLLKAVHDATLRGKLIDAKNFAAELSHTADLLDKSFDQHIIVHEPDGSYTVNVEQNVN
jgi:hypothetical protein